MHTAVAQACCGIVRWDDILHAYNVSGCSFLRQERDAVHVLTCIVLQRASSPHHRITHSILFWEIGMFCAKTKLQLAATPQHMSATQPAVELANRGLIGLN